MIEKEIAYICNYCRKIVCEESNGVDFYSVDDLSGVFKTTCSKACAENLKLKIVNDYQKKIDKINNQKIKKLKW